MPRPAGTRQTRARQNTIVSERVIGVKHGGKRILRRPVAAALPQRLGVAGAHFGIEQRHTAARYTPFGNVAQ